MAVNKAPGENPPLLTYLAVWVPNRGWIADGQHTREEFVSCLRSAYITQNKRHAKTLKTRFEGSTIWQFSIGTLDR